MKIKGSSYFFIVIMATMLAVIILSLTLEYFASKLMPLLIGSIVFILAAIGLGREIRTQGEPEATVTKSETETSKEAEGGWGRYLAIGAWTLGFFLAIWSLGYLIAIPLFLFSYTKTHGTSWLVSIIITVVTTGTVYGVFELTLNIKLHPGLLLTWLGY